MKMIGLLQNTIQFYAWGSPSAIPELLDKENPSGKPWAELWMGAHSKASSLVSYEGKRLPLIELIQKYPHEILGPDISETFHNKLPYLFKVLAAAKPLSIQAHPDLAQARDGFERENRQNIPLDAPNRNYKDANHKPECICAVSKFYALSGFRTIPEIIGLMTSACPAGLSDELDRLKTNPDSYGLKVFYTDLMTMDPAKQKRIVDEAVQNIAKIYDQNSIDWMKKLSEEYPSDIGVLSPILLNLICLEPGQALFLPAGELHAYLEGLGVELMANSDNVLRGGLTAKHIDLPELLKVVNFEPRPIDLLQTRDCGENEKLFITPANEFVLSSISVSEERSYLSSTHRSAEIVLCSAGEAVLQDIAAKNSIIIKKGDSVLIPAAVKVYKINGNAVFYKAAVPIIL
ncbi:Mannose-6-phosphate isomerase (EC [Olavius sp. associated proteobacterium Delta 1]|nr:Mannose-6-phosphate isomerase (EC [Olavius sp. associated proteobacterium Delta 1]